MLQNGRAINIRANKIEGKKKWLSISIIISSKHLIQDLILNSIKILKSEQNAVPCR